MRCEERPTLFVLAPGGGEIPVVLVSLSLFLARGSCRQARSAGGNGSFDGTCRAVSTPTKTG